MINWLKSLPANEPVLVGSAVSAGLTVCASLGLHLSSDQILAASTGATGVVAFLIRAFVTPVASPPPPAPAAQGPVA